MAEPDSLKLGSRPLRLAELRRVYAGPVTVSIEPSALAAVREAHATTLRLAAADAPAYGINTGFGLLAQTRIAPAQRALLQRNIILSHSSGVGPLLDDAVVRLTLVLKLASLLQGFSGVSIAADPLPRAADQRRPYAVRAGAGLGRCLGRSRAARAPVAACCSDSATSAGAASSCPPARRWRRRASRRSTLGPKEGLALLNGTQVSTALALAGLFELETVFAGAVVSGALSLDALQGSDAPFDPRIHHLRGHDGQARVAQVYRELLAGSQIRESHRDCSARAGSVLAALPAAGDGRLPRPHDAAGRRRSSPKPTPSPTTRSSSPTPTKCSRAATSTPSRSPSPRICSRSPARRSAAIAERRIALLVDPKMSGLPAFLRPDSGVNSGFMMAQVTAAALVAENRMLCHPASVDSIPDLREPGRSRQHGDARRAAAAQHGGQRR